MNKNNTIYNGTQQKERFGPYFDPKTNRCIITELYISGCTIKYSGNDIPWEVENKSRIKFNKLMVENKFWFKSVQYKIVINIYNKCANK